jgi:hypothetical protein
MTTLSDPANGVFLITPSDTVDLLEYTRAIRANTAGVINILCVDGVTTACNFLAGETRAIRARRIMAASTTATGIEGMY